MVGYDEARKIELFTPLMTLDEEAGDWWEGLKKMGNERDIKKFQPTELELKAEDIGTMVEHRGGKVPAHHAFTEEALALGTAIGDASGLLIDDVRRRLPDAIRRLIANETYRNWEKFYDSLLVICMMALMEAKRDADIMTQCHNHVTQPSPPPPEHFHTTSDSILQSPQPTTLTPCSSTPPINLIHQSSVLDP
ncbi:hypothetical protein JB92DRAFT_3126050 [Gautieria morchelliformis]|nr:hypothetical protein JB92DRAFT_3126050 [Gautieria morchelliformis]